MLGCVWFEVIAHEIPQMVAGRDLEAVGQRGTGTPGRND